MARLPSHDVAILEIRKIADYCLNPWHPRGRHKARVFRQALGVERGDASWLRDALLAGLHDNDAAEPAVDEQGTRWRVDVPVARQGKRVVVRTVWIVRTGEHIPGLSLAGCCDG